MFRRRQVSTIGMMAATLGPASWLPRWIQFLRPRATGRIAFSARLLESSNSGYSRKRLSRLQCVSVYHRNRIGTETHWGTGRRRRDHQVQGTGQKNDTSHCFYFVGGMRVPLVDDCKNKRYMINFLDESRGGQD